MGPKDGPKDGPPEGHIDSKTIMGIKVPLRGPFVTQ